MSKAEVLNGESPIDPENTHFKEMPEPKIQNGKLTCPICNDTFEFLSTYHQHARDIHKAGTSTSSATY
jgi:hypothetical protein